MEFVVKDYELKTREDIDGCFEPYVGLSYSAPTLLFMLDVDGIENITEQQILYYKSETGDIWRNIQRGVRYWKAKTINQSPFGNSNIDGALIKLASDLSACTANVERYRALCAFKNIWDIKITKAGRGKQ